MVRRDHGLDCVFAGELPLPNELCSDFDFPRCALGEDQISRQQECVVGTGEMLLPQ
jgi:hypothetical protein